MSSVLIMLGMVVLYVIAYHTYGKFLAKKIFRLSPKNVCPSEAQRDDVDYVPTKKFILFGHHFTSIAGTGPIVGPAIGIIWGWVPALLWVLLGSIFMGGVHDLGALVVSLRNQGHSIGDVADKYIGRRVQLMFMVIIMLGLWIVIAVFGLIIAIVFDIFPQSVLPVFLQIPIAVWLGYQFYKKKSGYIISTILALILLYSFVVLGAFVPFRLPEIFGVDPVGSWTIILLIYAYIASTLPVQVLLQPRDFINAYQLLLTMALLAMGVLFTNPPMVAPSVNLAPAGAPSVWPMLFVIIACGAISGFHALVSSGTSSKQCDKEPSALFVGYGSMLTEGMLAVFVILACGAGIGLGLEHEGELLRGTEAFRQHYQNWQAVQGMGSKIHAFVSGSTNMVSKLGIPPQIIVTLMGVFIASFAATTLDTATRLQRYVVAECARSINLKFFTQKHAATAFAVITALILAFYNGTGKGALVLWPLFGTCNQLLAGLSLLVITVYLIRKKVTYGFTMIPMIFMFVMTSWAMKINLVNFYNQKNWLLVFVGTIILILEIWIIIETVILLLKNKGISQIHTN
ncbi:MAG: carbon starvation protein A [Candidatus Marinimicrobia bacterium]|nr:carbon starvation protein A [Candidatus Neomarinimicrobiota bacterium]